MDSGNSGSIQSSSGGDEEYDSRADTIPAFLSASNPSGNYNHHPISTPSSSSLFNPPPNYLDTFSQSQANNPNHSLLNLDPVWSRGLQLDQQPYYTTLVGNLTGSSSSTTTNTSSTPTTMLRPVVHESGTGIVKNNNPKKRTRASRRAPTTVLTTDTSNFRAMVQEFTGIPAPPFSAVSSSYSRRLDLFGTGAAAAAMRSGNSDPLVSSLLYPLRPSAHKIHQTTSTQLNNVSSSPSFLNPSSIVDTSNHGQYKADHQDMLMNMQNDPMLTFQSLLQQPPQLNYSLADEAAHAFGTKSQGESQLEELRMVHGNDQNVNANINVHHRRWRDGGAGSNDNRSHEKGLEMINNNVSSRGGGEVFKK